MRAKLSGFTMLEMAITLAIFAVLVAIGGPAYSRFHARSLQSDARIELTTIFGLEAAFKEQNRTYHMNFAEMGYIAQAVNQTNWSDTTNPYMSRVYAISAGGPVNPAIDDAKPVTFASLSITVTRPDSKGYAGWIAPNSAVCNVTAADAYGATGGSTPNATATTLVVTAKGCPKKYLSGSGFDVIYIDEDGILHQVYDASGD